MALVGKAQLVRVDQISSPATSGVNAAGPVDADSRARTGSSPSNPNSSGCGPTRSRLEPVPSVLRMRRHTFRPGAGPPNDGRERSWLRADARALNPIHSRRRSQRREMGSAAVDPPGAVCVEVPFPASIVTRTPSAVGSRPTERPALETVDPGRCHGGASRPRACATASGQRCCLLPPCPSRAPLF